MFLSCGEGRIIRRTPLFKSVVNRGPNGELRQGAVPAVAGLFLPRETGRGAARVQLDCGLTVLVSPA
jgi:hypothetical protein